MSTYVVTLTLRTTAAHNPPLHTAHLIVTEDPEPALAAFIDHIQYERRTRPEALRP